MDVSKLRVMVPRKDKARTNLLASTAGSQSQPQFRDAMSAFGELLAGHCDEHHEVFQHVVPAFTSVWLQG